MSPVPILCSKNLLNVLSILLSPVPILFIPCMYNKSLLFVNQAGVCTLYTIPYIIYKRSSRPTSKNINYFLPDFKTNFCVSTGRVYTVQCTW